MDTFKTYCLLDEFPRIRSEVQLNKHCKCEHRAKSNVQPFPHLVVGNSLLQLFRIELLKSGDQVTVTCLHVLELTDQRNEMFGALRVVDGDFSPDVYILKPFHIGNLGDRLFVSYQVS